ncbi:uncharacterized protein LOC8274233 [Ricinus communis]|uniref:uncharacterized protein LOC8274233 n=1 Tax=Ricinus communis TaxID=3988 RepID=UPI00201A49A7|nr:uncharacterized protein LOC8274233 [Ricinus communis]
MVLLMILPSFVVIDLRETFYFFDVADMSLYVKFLDIGFIVYRQAHCNYPVNRSPCAFITGDLILRSDCIAKFGRFKRIQVYASKCGSCNLCGGEHLLVQSKRMEEVSLSGATGTNSNEDFWLDFEEPSQPLV